MHFIFSAILVASCFGISTGVKLEYSCAKDPGGGTARLVNVKFTEDAGDDIRAIYSADGQNKCEDPVTVDKWTTYEVAKNAGDQDPAFTCGVTPDTADGKDEYTLKFQTVSSNGMIIRDTDRLFTFKCDYNNLKQDVQGNPQTMDASSLPPGDVKQAQLDIQLSMVGANSLTEMAKCDIGTEVELLVTLTRPSFTSAQGLKMIDCVASNGATPPVTFSLIDQTGCPVAGGVLPDKKGFEPIVPQVDGKWQARSGTFKCFKFPSAPQVTFGCTAVYSTDKDVKSCNSKRRRRNVIRRSSEDQRDVTVVIRITNGNSTSDVSQKSRTDRHAECENRSYVIGLAILGCVLALTFIVTVGMFVVIKRSHQGNRNDKMTYDNKAMS